MRESCLLARAFRHGMSAAASDPGLPELREEIARIDHAIVRLVAARLRTAHQAIRLRATSGEQPTNRTQELTVLDRARRWADEVGLPPEFVARLMQALVNAGKTWTEPEGTQLPALPKVVSCRLDFRSHPEGRSSISQAGGSHLPGLPATASGPTRPAERVDA